MAVRDGWVTRPSPDADPRARSRQRTIGLAVALVGLMVVAVGAIGNFAIAGGLPGGSGGLAWTFGVGTTGLGILKIGVAIVLIGIVIRLWYRVESVKAALLTIVGSGDAGQVRSATITTDHGRARVTKDPPKPLPIHRMAKALWAPMLVMGAMALAIGLILSLATSAQAEGTTTFRSLWAWSQGTLFLGEGLLLSGISFLLGTILAGLRAGGGEVQRTLGVPVVTLKMPASAKAFIALMMLGMMLAILQFVLYAVAAAQAAGSASAFAVWSAWLGPLREVALGTLLLGIVLALYAISKALGFQFARIRELVTEAA